MRRETKKSFEFGRKIRWKKYLNRGVINFLNLCARLMEDFLRNGRAGDPTFSLLLMSDSEECII
jgi:hypothetical protein